MANINLISARRAERLRLTRVARGMMLGVLSAVTVGLGMVAFMTGQWVVTTSRVAATEAQLVLLRPVLDEIDQAKKERELLLPRLSTLTDAQKQTNRWIGIMEGLKRAVPEQTWLTSVSVERNAEGPQAVKLNGVTINQTRVGETMLRLAQQQEYYQTVDLRYTATSNREGLDNVEFEVAARLVQPESPAKEKVGNAN